MKASESVGRNNIVNDTSRGTFEYHAHKILAQIMTDTGGEVKIAAKQCDRG